MRLLLAPPGGDLPPSPTGIDLGDEELEALYLPPPGRHVRANFVLSLDGAAEFDGRSGPLASADDKRLFHIMRAVADVILVGAGTVRRENYGPARIPEDRRRRRLERGQSPQPPVAVVTSSGALDPTARLFEGHGGDGYVPPILFVGDAVPESRREELAEVADVVAGDSGAVSMAAVIDELARRGMRRVLCEGGPVVVSELLSGGLVDEMCLTHSTVLAGPGRERLTTGAPFDQPLPLETRLLIHGDGAILGSYTLRREGR